MEEPSKLNNALSIPVAIVIAGALIAGAIYMGTSRVDTDGTEQPQVAERQQSGDLEQMMPIGNEDHIRGNPDAPVKIVEYSDFECPFCKRFHDTMNQIMDEYGENGDVAWVYRQFPLDQLHPVKARAEAVASECAAELGGNDAFWQFADRFMELTPSNNQTDIETVIPQIVREIGLDESAFQTCFESGKYDQHVQVDVNNAIATGGNGTPWSIIVTESGKKYPLSGAQPYTAVKQLIELALSQK